MEVHPSSHAEDRKCPECGKEGNLENYRAWMLGKASKWYFEYHCPHCGHDWKREDKSK
jgi:predicted RNA-binding Zn-ribbon protein involved in translation (DUF1610 family)